MERFLPAMTMPVLRLFPIAVVLLAGCAADVVSPGTAVQLTGAQEVPPVTTSATGTGRITVSPDRAVNGDVTTAGVDGTAAHVHEGAPGKNGPVAIPLSKTSDATWTVPAGAKLSESQYASYKAGNLYVNVHSTAQPGGEIRGQIKPPVEAEPTRRYGY